MFNYVSRAVLAGQVNGFQLPMETQYNFHFMCIKFYPKAQQHLKKTSILYYLWINCQCHITKESLWTCRSYSQPIIPIKWVILIENHR